MPAATAGDAPTPTRDNTCLHPVTGVNLNELFGVPEQLVTARGGPTVGEHWRPFIAYFGAEASKAVYPQGYVPLYPSPVDDILAKLTITVVVDGGTRHEKSYTFSPTDEDAFRTDLSSTTSTRQTPTCRVHRHPADGATQPRPPHLRVPRGAE